MKNAEWILNFPWETLKIPNHGSGDIFGLKASHLYVNLV